MDTFKQNLTKTVVSAKEKVEALRKEDSLVFPVFTDLHSEGADCEWLIKLCEALKLITEEIQCDMVANLGDNLGMLGRNQHISNKNLKTLFKDMLDIIYESINCPLITANGNHDAIGTDFFKPDFWNDIVKNNYGNTNAVYDTTGSYYYVDFEKAKTRFVVLSVPSESDLDAEHPTPLWAFGKKQIDWLEKEALDVKDNVIILIHVPFYYHDNGDKATFIEVWNGEKTAMSYITDLYGRIEDVDKAIAVIDEFNEKSDTNLVACFSGHTHCDSLLPPHQERISNSECDFNPLPCHQIVTTGTFIPESEHKEFGISIDIAVWTPSENELNIIRVGDGDDRNIFTSDVQ